MNSSQKFKRPPWRLITVGAGVLVLLMGAYLAWTPGLDVRDGRHDRGSNGIWISHGWLGANDWFIRNRKTNEFARYRNQTQIRQLAEQLRHHRITDVFAHLCPADADGPIPPVDDVQVERFLDEFAGFRVMPWIGGVRDRHVHTGDPRWRTAFIASVRDLLKRHDRFAGIQLNLEPLRSGDRDFLVLLEELRAMLPTDKVLSVAAYPPPTRWHPYPEVHWNEDYFRAVAKRSDQLAVMMYDTALKAPKLYQHLMSQWTAEVLAWSEGKPVLLGVPTYDDAGVGYHHPQVEHLENAIFGIHRALTRRHPPPNYQGVAIYCEWETDPTEWRFFEQHFLKT